MNTCPQCGKPFVTVDTKTDEEYRYRYQGCRACGEKGGKKVIPLQYAPKRTSRPFPTSGKQCG